jgi:hypothetical protein
MLTYAVDLAMLAAAAGVRSNSNINSNSNTDTDTEPQNRQGNSSVAVHRMLEHAEADAHPLVAAMLQQQVEEKKTPRADVW